jgi:hypothetical protein
LAQQTNLVQGETMKIFIKETSASAVLSLIDPKSGTEYASDFVGSEGATSDGQFTWDEALDAYVCDQATFDWWDTVVTDHQALDDRTHALVQIHGLHEVYEVIDSAGSGDLENHAANVNQAFDAAFGPAK